MAQKNSKKKNNLNNLIKKNQDIFGLKKAWLQGKAALTSPANPLPERGLLFEALEPRVLMSADLSFGATATDLTLTFNGVDTYSLVDQTNNTVVNSAQTADGVINITGTVNNDFLTLDLTNFSTPVSINFLGGGSDTLAGDAVDTTWDLTGQNAGKVNTNIDFTGFENLVGGSGSDLFNFADGATITGTVDGGAGSNSLDYTEYKTAITVDLGNHTATGTGGATDFDDLTGGEVSDTLIGIRVDSTWDIAGADSGTINGTAFTFSGFENLTGADSTNDSFILEDAGSLSGVMDGGAGGLDSLLVIDSTANTNYALVNVVDSNAASVTLFTKTVNYTGLEPIISGTASDKIVLGSGLSDQLVLDSVDSSTLRIASTSADIFDVATQTTVTSLSFAKPTNTLTFSLGSGNDHLTLGEITPAFTGQVIFAGGDGQNVLSGADSNNTWNINGLNTGTLNNGFLTFVGVGTLVGGSVQDNFNFVGAASVDGTISGGAGGFDTVDFSAASNSITLKLNEKYLGIDRFIGSSATTDKLVGALGSSVWTVNGLNQGDVVATASTIMQLVSSTVVDIASNSLQFAYANRFNDGDQIHYQGNNDSAGLFINTDYYVLAINSNTIKLTTTLSSVAVMNDLAWTAGTRTLTTTSGASILFDGTEYIDGTQQTITFDNVHGLRDGDQLAYSFVGSEDNSQLENGKAYSVLVIDAKTIKLLLTAPTLVNFSSPVDWTSGIRSLVSVQQIADVEFIDFENLQGLSGEDRFEFVGNMASIGGAIDGGLGLLMALLKVLQRAMNSVLLHSGVWVNGYSFYMMAALKICKQRYKHIKAVVVMVTKRQRRMQLLINSSNSLLTVNKML